MRQVTDIKNVMRLKYLNAFKNLRNTTKPILVTGVCGSGKTWIVESYISALSEEENVNVIRASLDNPKKEENKEKKILALAGEKYKEDLTNIILIDNACYFKELKNTIKEAQGIGIKDIFIISSNDGPRIKESLAYDVEEVNVLPYSFKEYAVCLNEGGESDIFASYLKYGGIPENVQKNTENIAYRKDLTEKIFQKSADIRRGCSDKLLRKTARYLALNAGKAVSLRKMARDISEGDTLTNDKTISTYISYLEDAGLIFQVPFYDASKKEMLPNKREYFFSDHSFMTDLCLDEKIPDLDKLKNITATELKRRGYDIFSVQHYGDNIDFLAKKSGMKIYIQLVSDAENKEEISEKKASMLKIRDAYPKMIITPGNASSADADGVLFTGIEKFLLGSQF